MGFIDTYFLSPIRVEQGYNYINTVTYAVITLFALYALFLLFKKWNVKINYKFFVSAFSFVFIGAAIRAFVDHGLIWRGFWTVSPGIYLLTTGLFLLFLFIGLILKEQELVKDWHGPAIIFGRLFMFGIAIYFFGNMGVENIFLTVSLIALIVLATFGFYQLFLKLNWEWLTNRYGFTAFTGHLFDAIITAMILYFVGGWEKHPLPRMFIENFGAFSFIPLKLLVIIPSIYVINKEVKDKQFRDYLLIAIAILGFGEGLRNILSLILT
jgi:uncharacterized membrane protein